MAVVGIPTNRTSIDLPVDVSREIIAKTQEASKVMQLARQIELPGRGAAINVITSDPEAAWVGETAKKPVSNPGLATKVMRAYKLAVIVPFSNEFRRDVAALYDACINRLPGALGSKFDNTVFGGTQAPGSDFDTFANVTAQEIKTNTYDGLVAADTDIATHGGIVNGYVISPQGRGILLGAKDGDERPLFINSVAEGAIPMILGARVEQSKAAYIPGNASASPAVPAKVGFVGDWTQAMYGTVEGVVIDFSSDATLDLGEGETINLFQQNMFAVRAEIEVGFRADTSVFNALTAAN
jgi:HK97 family phage major capsid protein